MYKKMKNIMNTNSSIKNQNALLRYAYYRYFTTTVCGTKTE